MNKYIRKYNHIVKILVKKSFPSLEGIDINIREERLRRCFIGAQRIFNRYIIIVNPSIRKAKASKKALIGAFAHELVHLENFRKMNYLRLIIYLFRYQFNKEFRKREERMTDKITVFRGYGQELIIYSKFMKKLLEIWSMEFYHKMMQNYLSSKEIRGYMKKNKKK